MHAILVFIEPRLASNGMVPCERTHIYPLSQSDTFGWASFTLIWFCRKKFLRKRESDISCETIRHLERKILVATGNYEHKSDPDLRGSISHDRPRHDTSFYRKCPLWAQKRTLNMKLDSTPTSRQN